MRKLPPRITIKIIRITNTNDVTPMCYSLKNILALIIKNCDYFVKKQWLTLKKFNLHEKIYREETKIILANEKQKLNEIYTEAIEKLAACHMIGFEPLTIIRTKILNKLQIKYSISEENIKELANHFN